MLNLQIECLRYDGAAHHPAWHFTSKEDVTQVTSLEGSRPLIRHSTGGKPPTRTIPIVFVNVSDPVGAGFAASIAGELRQKTIHLSGARERVAMPADRKDEPVMRMLAPAHGLLMLAQSSEAEGEPLALEPERGLRLEKAFARGAGHGRLLLGADEVGTNSSWPLSNRSQSLTTESLVEFRMQKRKLKNLELRLRAETRAFRPENGN